MENQVLLSWEMPDICLSGQPKFSLVFVCSATTFSCCCHGLFLRQGPNSYEVRSGYEINTLKLGSTKPGVSQVSFILQHCTPALLHFMPSLNTVSKFRLSVQMQMCYFLTSVSLILPVLQSLNALSLVSNKQCSKTSIESNNLKGSVMWMDCEPPIQHYCT